MLLYHFFVELLPDLYESVSAKIVDTAIITMLSIDQATSNRSFHKAFAYQKSDKKQQSGEIKEFNDDPEDIDIPMKRVEDENFDYDRNALSV